MAKRWWNRARFDVVEVCVVASFAAFTAWEAGVRWPSWETKALTRVYGASQYSYGLEEVIIRDFFRDARGGFFVDVGAGDYKKDSNTFYLEERLGWSGIAVDALATYAADYAAHRPHTRFFARFVSDVSERDATVFVPSDKRQTAYFRRPEYGAAVETHVPTVTLNDLLTAQGVTRIDVLSVDVELAELRVLAGFDVERFRPRLVCIEAFRPVRQRIIDYFVRHRYVVLGAYLHVDNRNLYFTPLP